MSVNLYPTFDVPEIQVETAEDESYKGSWHFDFETGEFMTDGGNKVQPCEAYVAWAHWCIKSVQVERFSCLAYSSDIGIEADEIRKQTTRQGAESVFEKTVTEALKVHPNTDSVQDFTFSWESGSINGEFTVIPVQGMPISVSAVIKL